MRREFQCIEIFIYYKLVTQSLQDCNFLKRQEVVLTEGVKLNFNLFKKKKLSDGQVKYTEYSESAKSETYTEYSESASSETYSKVLLIQLVLTVGIFVVWMKFTFNIVSK